MSDFTFNIADYRPLSFDRFHRAPGRTPEANRPGGFVVFSSHSESREYQSGWLDAGSEVVDIRAVRDTHRTGHLLAYPRRAKILRFGSEVRQRVCTMPVRENGMPPDNDPDPEAA